MNRASNRPGVLRTVSLTLLLVPLLAATVAARTPARYPAEPGLIEVVFAPESRVRLRDGVLRDFGAPALAGVDDALEPATAASWEKLSHVPEESVDRMRETGMANMGRTPARARAADPPRRRGPLGDRAHAEPARRRRRRGGRTGRRGTPFPREPPSHAGDRQPRGHRGSADAARGLRGTAERAGARRRDGHGRGGRAGPCGERGPVGRRDGRRQSIPYSVQRRSTWRTTAGSISSAAG